LAELAPDTPLSELRQSASDTGMAAVDPEQLARRAEECGYEVELRWADAQREHCFDVVMVRHDHQSPPVGLRRDPTAIEPWSALVNNPLFSKTTESLLPDLRHWLRERLPEHMVPSAWMFLDALPLTPNGKIDRKALPTLVGGREQLGQPYVGPRTAIEELLASIWADVLKLDQVGIHDNFFELGGHSLLAAQVVARIREKLDTEISVRSLFLTPSIAQLAASVQEQGHAVTAPAIRQRKRQGSSVSSHAQQRLWFLDQYEPGTGLYNIPMAWRVRGGLNVAALARSLDEVIHRHEVLRTTFAFEGDVPVQVIAQALPLNLQVLDLTDRADAHDEASRLAQEEAERPFELARGPLIRAAVIKLGSLEHLLLITVHHVIFDGWSMGVLARELSALYQAFARGQPSPLPRLEIQYADFAMWQREWLQGEVLQRQLDHWRHRLEGAPPALELPTDRPRPVVPSHQGAAVAFELGPELSERLRRLSRDTGTTLFMTLAAAFNVLLGRYSRQEDISIGYPVANRNRTETEGLIGFFVNTLVLRTKLQPEQKFDALLRQVREAVLDADAHQDLPFETLVEALRPERNLSHSPLFQVMLALNNTSAGDDALTLGELQVECVSRTETAKFDLTLHVADSGSQLS
jgi:acyl carrier protein